MQRRAISILLATAAALAAAPAFAAAGVTANKAVMMQQASRRFEFRRENLWGGGSGWDSDRRFRHGWSNRQVQRMARKKRNQARHRRACRG